MSRLTREAVAAAVRRQLMAGHEPERLIAAANWKMNHTGTEADAFLQDFRKPKTEAEMWIAPPAVLLERMHRWISRRSLPISLAAQDIHDQAGGAYTGSLSAAQVKEAGAAGVLLGHSERRAAGDTAEAIREKASRASEEGLTVFHCIGETEDVFEAGGTLEMLTAQLDESMHLPGGNLIIAYEPVWAIGTGRTADEAAITAVHAHIHAIRPDVPILYGGSVKPDGAAAISAIPHVSGALIGGAGLEAASYTDIIREMDQGRRGSR
ncbi:triose-phosphate isomerase [Alkalicoccus chagannorensis]|uniref:triose-phosphate isomerase n=1 Tax=Alkalicoccus chagannorensis TaxID=427072 RepID=UPI00041FCD26|nr:triose-phosphate isomerase [Alkalicoccus chagannorensis]